MALYREPQYWLIVGIGPAHKTMLLLLLLCFTVPSTEGLTVTCAAAFELS